MARFDAIVTLGDASLGRSWSTPVAACLDPLGFAVVGVPRGPCLEAVRSGDHRLPALRLLVIEHPSGSRDGLEVSLTSAESMAGGATYTRTVFGELIVSLQGRLPSLTVIRRSDLDGPLSRGGR
ncbi:MAG: hypothetical protein K9J72_08675 [Synechococcus sp. Tobar2m-G35]|jgi:hypothetical protein|nr:hypothetical protein [Synechococcus sp. Tobar2m-G35]